MTDCMFCGPIKEENAAAHILTEAHKEAARKHWGDKRNPEMPVFEVGQRWARPDGGVVKISVVNGDQITYRWVPATSMNHTGTVRDTAFRTLFPHRRL